MGGDTRTFGFPPIAAPDARSLILGTLPGRDSLAAGEYYASPRNAFWKIAAYYLDALPSDYSQRMTRVTQHGVAIWDVLAGATREGSLDADIGPDAIPNHFRALFHLYPSIQLIAFNGERPAELYRRLVLPVLDERHRAIERKLLPSTSSARANISFEQKIAHWGAVWQR